MVPLPGRVDGQGWAAALARLRAARACGALDASEWPQGAAVPHRVVWHDGWIVGVAAAPRAALEVAPGALGPSQWAPHLRWLARRPGLFLSFHVMLQARGNGPRLDPRCLDLGAAGRASTSVGAAAGPGSGPAARPEPAPRRGIDLARGHAASVLGVDPNATPEEIRQAFRRWAFVWHPDRHQQAGGAERARAALRFARARQAYAVLTRSSRAA